MSDFSTRYYDELSEDERQRFIEDEAETQRRSFIALAWVGVFITTFLLLLFAYERIQRTVDCIDFVSAPNYAPPPGSCKRE